MYNQIAMFYSTFQLIVSQWFLDMLSDFVLHSLKYWNLCYLPNLPPTKSSSGDLVVIVVLNLFAFDLKGEEYKS